MPGNGRAFKGHRHNAADLETARPPDWHTETDWTSAAKDALLCVSAGGPARLAMRASPSTHFVSFAQSILLRGAGFSVIWPDYLFVALVGGLFMFLALIRFRTVAAVQVT
jgi:hypothetical protein